MSRHRFEVATQKEDIVGHNRQLISLQEDIVANSLLGNLMSRQKCKLRTPIEVATRISCCDIKMS